MWENFGEIGFDPEDVAHREMLAKGGPYRKPVTKGYSRRSGVLVIKETAERPGTDFLDTIADSSPDPLQILLMKEEGILNEDEIEEAVEKKDGGEAEAFITETNVLHFSDEIPKTPSSIVVFVEIDRGEYLDGGYKSRIKTFVPKLEPISPGRMRNGNYNHGFSHGWRGRKPALRKHKRLAKHERHKLSKEVREIIMV